MNTPSDPTHPPKAQQPTTPPQKVSFDQQSSRLTLQFANQEMAFSAEFLRVHSPSAEVQGHGPGQDVLQHGKRNVRIHKLEPAGNYGLRLYFDDDHNTGLYSWQYLYNLGSQQEQLWQAYLDKLHAAQLSRDPEERVVRLIDS